MSDVPFSYLGRDVKGNQDAVEAIDRQIAQLQAQCNALQERIRSLHVEQSRLRGQRSWDAHRSDSKRWSLDSWLNKDQSMPFRKRGKQ
jgi:predicted nuclease with TOPRIM domain